MGWNKKRWGSGKAPWYKGKWGFTIKLLKSTGLSAVLNSGTGGVLLTADEAPEATSYNYFYAVDSGDWKLAATEQDTTYTFIPNEAGEHSFAVTAVKGSTETEKTEHIPGNLFNDVGNSEGFALMAFYNSTNGDSWDDNTNWMVDSTVGNWFGISTSSGNVTEIDIFFNNISGSGLQHLPALPSLNYLYMNSPTLSGDIINLSELTLLTYIHMGGTSIFGDITNVSELTSLNHLSMERTLVSGSIADISGLTSLDFIGLRFNESISGDISNISEMNLLEFLYLDSTSVSGDISNVSEMTSLQALYLDSTSVSGNVANISGITSLARLFLYNTSVSGNIADLNTLSNLAGSNDWEGLQLYNSDINDYTSTSLPAWGCYIDISDLDLSQTEVDNFICDLNTAGGTGGALVVSGTNSAPSSTGESCIDNLRSKNWTVTVTGEY